MAIIENLKFTPIHWTTLDLSPPSKQNGVKAKTRLEEIKTHFTPALDMPQHQPYYEHVYFTFHLTSRSQTKNLKEAMNTNSS